MDLISLFGSTINVLQKLLDLHKPTKLSLSEKVKIADDFIKNSLENSDMSPLAYELKDSVIFEAYYGFQVGAELRNSIDRLYRESRGEISLHAIRSSYRFLKPSDNINIPVDVKIPKCDRLFCNIFQVLAIILFFAASVPVFYNPRPLPGIAFAIFCLLTSVFLLLTSTPIHNARLVEKHINNLKRILARENIQ